MKYSENVINILTAKTFKGIGNAWIVNNFKGNESVEEILYLINTQSKQKEEISMVQFKIIKNRVTDVLNSFKNHCDGAVAIGDTDFPQHRGKVKNSQRPVCVFYKGNINLLQLNNPSMSVIGLLNPTEDIEIREKEFVANIVNNGITIVSGLALGCDSIAHKVALKSGKTIAILPNTLDKVMPSQNEKLASQIVENGGLLLTEYYENFKSNHELVGRYQERDRLQALFCDTIILTASYAKESAKIWNIIDKKLDSGARLAMSYAKEFGIPRVVLYDKELDANNPMFDLNRDLIAEDRKITIMSNTTIKHIIDTVLNKKKNIYNKIQPSLFD